MCSGLKPCPFCGGEARIIAKPYEPKVCVGCDDDTCLGFSGLGWLYDSEKEATEAWNRRAERTCRWKNVEGTLFVSECGGSFDRVVSDAYCPNCGAKVVDTDDA